MVAYNRAYFTVAVNIIPRLCNALQTTGTLYTKQKF